MTLIKCYLEEGAMSNLMIFLEKMEISLISKLTNDNLKKLSTLDLQLWSEIALIHIQTEGLLFGYNSKSPKNQKMTMKDMYFVNADGQIPELLTIFKKVDSSFFESFRLIEDGKTKEQEDGNNFGVLFQEYGTTDPDYLWDKLMSRSHCSAFIKILRGEDMQIKDVLLSHSTWDDYSAMIRIFKQLSFFFTNKIIIF